jgi:formimidoylglutamate deiminase
MTDQNKLTTLFARHAWLEQGWAENVRLHWNEQGNLTQIEQHAVATKDEQIEQIVVPGMVNLHSHAFQRAIAGMTEIAGEGPDSFWTWRDLMYRFALAINPEQIQAIAAQLYSECLRHGYTSVCEFHYLHRAPDGEFYDNMAETALRVIAAAQDTGIGITMLPVLYSYADFNEQPLRHEQRRFSTNPEQILKLIELLEASRNGQTEVGVAPHSLRAASTQQITELVRALPSQRPIHIHIAEQQKEVDSCIAYSGKRPVELLFATQEVDQRWCLVHATHLTAHEVTQIAHSKSIAGICTSTEGNLGDGFFPLSDFIAQQGRFGIGSDSHVSQSPIEELRWLEYGQRLRAQRRNIASVVGQRHIGDFLWQASLRGGAQATGRNVGSLAVGQRADLLVLDANHPNLTDIASADILNSWIFSGNDNLVRDVLVGGKWRVKNGQHLNQSDIQQRFKQTMHQLRAL